MTQGITPSHPELEVDRITYRQLLALAGEILGYGRTGEDGLPAPPTNAGQLYRARRSVMSGLRRWESSNRSGWAVLYQEHRLTFVTDGSGAWNVGGDAAIYRMPWSFNGENIENWYDVDNGDRIRVITQTELNRKKAHGYGTSTASRPEYAVFTRIPADRLTSQFRNGWQVEFWPTPSTAYTYRVGYRASVAGMSQESDVFFAGHPYDRSLEAWVKYEAAVEGRRDTETREMYLREASIATEEALTHDERLRPVLVGQMSAAQLQDPELNRAKTLTINGISLGSVNA